VLHLSGSPNHPRTCQESLTTKRNENDLLA
jgi:hypothetical protein